MAMAMTEAAVTAELVRITPTKAEAMLAKNTSNRNLRPTVVRRYARDITNGDWVLNGETIKVSSSGRILDGQHRLQAIIEADIALDVFVIFGLPDDAQETIDRGLPRNIQDALRLRGEVSANLLAATISNAVLLKAESPSQIADYWPSTSEALHFLEAHPSIRESVTIAGRVNKAVRLPGGPVGALHFLFSELDSEDADVFWERVIDGVDLDLNSPILRFREFSLREITAQRRVGKTRLCALAIKSWNTWRRGDDMYQLKWKVGGSHPETFPRPE